MTGVRLSADLEAAIAAWAKAQHDTPKKAEAIRRLLEIGLANAQAMRNARAQSADLAGQTIDRLADQTVPAEDRAERKRRLLKGPKEFRDIRDDLPKRKERR
jgi:hypothetical protein